MSGTRDAQGVVRFGSFEADLRTRELRKLGVCRQLPDQSFQILKMLLERPGELVTREELQQALWPSDTYVDFDHGVNAAVNRLRSTLGDSADNPKFVETLTRRGYRFIGTIDVPSTGEAPDQPQAAQLGESTSPITTDEGFQSFSESGNPRKFTVPNVRLHRWFRGYRILPFALLILAISLAGGFSWLNQPLAPPRVLKVVQITHDGVPKLGLVTDGSRLYINEASVGGTLVQVSVTGGDTSMIPTPFLNPHASDISSDRTQLLVGDGVSGASELRYWSLPLPTGTPRRLDDLIGRGATWSPDGQRLAFGKGSDIYLAGADGMDAQKLVTVQGTPFGLRFSPDGKRIRFTVGNLERHFSSLWEVRTDGSNPQSLFPLSPTRPSECCGAWTADGRYYLFVSTVFRTSNLWVLPEPTGLLHKHPTAYQLTIGPISYTSFVPAPDGKRVFADGRLLRGELVRYDSRFHQLVPFFSGISAGELDFSRDGKWVAYVSYPERTLWRSRVDGSDRFQLTYPPVSVFLPRWSPDGTEIAYADRQPGRPMKIFFVSPQGGTPNEMLDEKQSQEDATWSPDGRRIAYGRDLNTALRGEKVTIQLLDLGTKQVSTVPGSESLFSPRWSPDGKYLAAVSTDLKKLVRFDFKKQKWFEWITEPGSPDYPTWSRDSQYVYYETSSTERPGYHRVGIGHSRSEFLFPTKNLSQFEGAGFGSWSGLAPDGSPLFVRDTSTDEIYALDLELP